MKILVVEDDPTLLRMYELVLPDWSPAISLTLAKNGYEGLVRIGEIKPDLLITDLMMPGIDGFMMLQSLRASRQLQSMNIVVVSGLSAAEIEERGGLPEDMPRFGKPIQFDKLEAHVRALLGERRAA